MSIAAFDVGATWIRAAVQQPSGKFSSPVRERTPSTGLKLLERLAEVGADLARRNNISTFGFAVPGLIDPAGVVIASTNLRVRNLPLKAELEARLRRSCIVVNDAHAQAIGAAGEKERSLFYITIGTGIGAAAVVENRLLVGRGFAGEIGHLQIAGLKEVISEGCYCGRNACLELVTSGRALERRLGPKWWMTETDATQAALIDAADALSVAAHVVRSILDPSRIHVVSRLVRHNSFLDSLVAAMNERGTVWPSTPLTWGESATEDGFRGLERLWGQIGHEQRLA